MEWIDSGSTLLNKVLGGGWASDRMARIMGKESAGKTFLMIASAANFMKMYPEGKVAIVDAEATLDSIPYAEKMGLTPDKVEFINCESVEQWGDEYQKWMRALKKGQPGFFGLDSMDALPTHEQVKAAKSEKSKMQNASGFEEARRAGTIRQILKAAVKPMDDYNVHFCCLSQVTSNPAAMFGSKTAVGGGTGPKYFASQCIDLKVIEKLSKTINLVKHPYGVWVEAYCSKNKVGIPFERCDFPIIFNQGIDDVYSCLEYLESKKQLFLLLPEELTGPPPKEEPKKNKDEESSEDPDEESETKKRKKGTITPKIIEKVSALAPDQRRKAVRLIKDTTGHFWDMSKLQLSESLTFLEED